MHVFVWRGSSDSVMTRGIGSQRSRLFANSPFPSKDPATFFSLSNSLIKLCAEIEIFSLPLNRAPLHYRSFLLMKLSSFIVVCFLQRQGAPPHALYCYLQVLFSDVYPFSWILHSFRFSFDFLSHPQQVPFMSAALSHLFFILRHGWTRLLSDTTIPFDAPLCAQETRPVHSLQFGQH